MLVAGKNWESARYCYPRSACAYAADMQSDATVRAVKQSEAFQHHADACWLYFASVCQVSADYTAAVPADLVPDPQLAGPARPPVEDICSRIVSLSFRDDTAHDHVVRVLAGVQGGWR